MKRRKRDGGIVGERNSQKDRKRQKDSGFEEERMRNEPREGGDCGVFGTVREGEVDKKMK